MLGRSNVSFVGGFVFELQSYTKCKIGYEVVYRREFGTLSAGNTFMKLKLKLNNGTDTPMYISFIWM